MKEIVIDEISVFVIRKPIKNMYLRIKPPDGRVEVTVPRNISEGEIIAFVNKKLSWIRRHRKEMAGRNLPSEKGYRTGDEVFVWGQRRRLEIYPTDQKGYVEQKGDRLLLYVNDGSTAKNRERILLEWYRTILKEAVPEVMARCEAIAGVSANEWRIKNMRTRWGTCNVKERRIWISLKLAEKPPECLSFVILHELAHLYERKHNKRFYALLTLFCPDWKNVMYLLNEQN